MGAQVGNKVAWIHAIKSVEERVDTGVKMDEINFRNVPWAQRGKTHSQFIIFTGRLEQKWIKRINSTCDRTRSSHQGFSGSRKPGGRRCQNIPTGVAFQLEGSWVTGWSVPGLQLLAPLRLCPSVRMKMSLTCDQQLHLSDGWSNDTPAVWKQTNKRTAKNVRKSLVHVSWWVINRRAQFLTTWFLYAVTVLPSDI